MLKFLIKKIEEKERKREENNYINILILYIYLNID